MEDQKEFKLGYHYKPSPEEAQQGLELLGQHNEQLEFKKYPDLRKIIIK